MSTLSAILHTIISRMGVSPVEEAKLHDDVSNLEGAAVVGAIGTLETGGNVGAGAAMAVKAVAGPMIEQAAGGLVHYVEQRILGIEPATAVAPLQAVLNANAVAPPPPPPEIEPETTAAAEASEAVNVAEVEAPPPPPPPVLEPAPAPVDPASTPFGAAPAPAPVAVPLFDAFTGEPLTNAPKFDVFTGKPLGA